jgi:hypothetical protein
MNPDYALLILKEQKETLLRFDSEKLMEKYPKENVERLKTRVKHQLASLEFAIEILETYQD